MGKVDYEYGAGLVLATRIHGCSRYAFCRKLRVQVVLPTLGDVHHVAILFQGFGSVTCVHHDPLSSRVGTVLIVCIEEDKVREFYAQRTCSDVGVLSCQSCS